MSNNFSFPVPAAASSLESYIHTVHSIPMLSAEEEHELAERFHAHQDVEAARQLVLSHLRVVVAVARQYHGYGLQQSDLIQEGNIGLMKAVKRFEPSRGVRLFSFAIHWIKAEIHEFILRNWRLVRIATTKAQRKLFFNLRSMKQSTGSLSPTEAQDIAEALGLKQEEVLEMDIRMNGQDIPLLREEADEAETAAPIDWLADESHEPVHRLERLAQDEMQGAGLERALAGLDERSRRIIQARWLEEEEAKTLHELAAEFGVSAERIRQLETKALQKMKGFFLA